MNNTKYTYVTDGDYIYRITLSKSSRRVNGDNSYLLNASIHWDLDLVAGKEYIAPDYNDIQGWVTYEAFIEDAQWQQLSQYIYSESLEDMLASEGFEIIENIPDVYEFNSYPLVKVDIDSLNI